MNMDNAYALFKLCVKIFGNIWITDLPNLSEICFYKNRTPCPILAVIQYVCWKWGSCRQWSSCAV